MTTPLLAALLSITTASLCAAGPRELVHSRPWRVGDAAEQSLCGIGNGRMLAYLRGPDVSYVWGPPYSSPNLARMTLQSPAGLTAVSSREAGTALWTHRLACDGKDAGEITDFVDAELPCLVRIIQTTTPLQIKVQAGGATLLETTPRYRDRTAVLCTHPVGSVVYGYRFRSQHPMTLQLVGEGSIRITTGDDGTVNIDVPPGRSVLYAVGGPEHPDCMRNTDAATSAGADAMLDRTRRWWRAELGRIRVPRAPAWLDKTLPRIAEGTAINVITQQATEGAVIAGHNYCLAYVFDQLGVARCLLELGLNDRARRNLEFYWQIFQRAGRLHQAQNVGGWPVFHVHENDEVTVTSYIIQQAFDYLDATGDNDFLRTILPMLEWAFEAQRRHLVRDMLPFNGDETYIAGGMIPRSVMDDGCAEATYMFFASGQRLADWAEKQRLWKPDRARADRELCNLVRTAYADNFIVDGRLMANNPARAEGLRKERFRHGVCQATTKGCWFFGWLELGEDGRYYCAPCYLQRKSVPFKPERHYLPSVALTSLFIGVPVETDAQLERELEQALKEFRSPDGRIAYPRRALPGYELGILLYAMTRQKHPDAQQVAEKLVDLLDPVGSWVEYYEGAQPKGTRYRPWESAINYAALANYARAAAPNEK